jgi:VWFA-related protein
MRRWLGVFCLVVGAFAQQEPEFRVGAHLVQVDVVVRDGRGPVTGLTKDDFVLFDKGKQQEISLFATSAGRNSVERTVPAPAEVSNRAVSNRSDGISGEAAATTVVLLDLLNSKIADQSFARGQMTRFVDAMGDSDRLALLVQKNGLVVLQDFTRGRNREQLVKAVEHLPFETGEDQLPRERTMAEAMYWWNVRRDITRQSLEAIVRHLAPLPGRKNLVWISGDFFYDQVRETLVWPDLLPLLKERNIALYMVGERGLVAPPSNVDRAVNRRQPINVRAAPPNDGAQNLGLEHVAQSTGGLGFFNSDDLQGSIQKAIDDTAATYTLGFYPSEAALDGALHPLKVKVARKGVEVRYRDSYYATAGDDATRQNAAPTLEELAMDPLDATAIGLTAVAQRSGNPAKLAVRAAVNVRDLRLEHKADRWRGSFDVAFAPGGGQRMKFRTINLDLSEEEFRAALGSPYSISIPLAAGAPGPVRIVVRDRATGNAGSLLLPLK